MRILVMVLGLMASLVACAQESQDSAVKSEKYQAGVHYQQLETPLRTISGDKVEVAELFQYGCGHCYNFEPSLKKWKQTLPANAALIKIPGTWGKEHSKVYYTGEMLGILDKSHDKAFEIMHNDPKRRPHQILKSEKEIQAFFEGLGVPADKFQKEYYGGSVKMAMSFADSNIRSLSKQMASKGIKVSTPSMVVAGKYYITMNKDVSNFDAMLKVTDFLIAKESK